MHNTRGPLEWQLLKRSVVTLHCEDEKRTLVVVVVTVMHVCHFWKAWETKISTDDANIPCITNWRGVFSDIIKYTQINKVEYYERCGLCSSSLYTKDAVVVDTIVAMETTDNGWQFLVFRFLHRLGCVWPNYNGTRMVPSWQEDTKKTTIYMPSSAS